MTHPLDVLHQTIVDRQGADPETSYTAKLLTRGIGRIAQKVGEEAVETALEAVRLEAGVSTPEKLAAESADLLYHLAVLWAAAGVAPEDVYRILAERQGISGIEEKGNRPSCHPGRSGDPGSRAE
jgi:phosphoribosyl-ATP pyrophosphohydrolase